MVTIRLARHGARKNPFYHITVADRAAKRDGRFIERVGFFNPLARGREEPLRVDLPRVDYWLSVGAQPSDRVQSLVKQARQQAQSALSAAAVVTDAVAGEAVEAGAGAVAAGAVEADADAVAEEAAAVPAKDDEASQEAAAAEADA